MSAGMSGREAFSIYCDGIRSKRPKEIFKEYVTMNENWHLGMEAIAAEFNRLAAKPVAPRMAHAAFWKTYYQWADGLEKVLISEAMDDQAVEYMLEQEYQAACKRLDELATVYADSDGAAHGDWPNAAKAAAIPARK